MNHYEITFISREEAEKEAVKKIIETFGGKIEQISSLGEKTFVYPIKKENRGFYTTFLFTFEPEKLIELTKKLNLKEEVTRFLIVAIKPNQIKAQIEKELAKTTFEESKKEQITETPKEVQIETQEKVEDQPIIEEKTKEKIEEKVEEPEEKTKKSTKKTEETKKKTKVVKEIKEKETPKPKKETPKKAEVEEPVDEEERLKALDKKLEELLKD